MNRQRSIMVWAPVASRPGAARIWVCGHCGAKVFLGRLGTEPNYRCLCGSDSWRPGQLATAHGCSGGGY